MIEEPFLQLVGNYFVLDFEFRSWMTIWKS